MGSPMFDRRRAAIGVTELERAQELGRAALSTLEANRARIDDLSADNQGVVP